MNVNIHDLDRLVIRQGYCVGCGVCATMVPSSVRIELDSYGRYQAIVKDSHASDRNVVCPFAPDMIDEDAISEALFSDCPSRHPILGFYRHIYAGHVMVGDFRQYGSSGGFVTWLCCQLIEKKIVHGIIHVRNTPDLSHDRPLFSYQISHTPEEVKQASGSKYYPVEMSEILERIQKSDARHAIVAIPCFAKAVRLLQIADETWSHRLPIVVGLLCGHMKSARFAEFLAWQMGINPSELVHFEFRGKSPETPANNYVNRAVARHGEAREKPLFELEGGDWGTGYFKYRACDFCDDIFAETADVAVGDAWLPRYVKDWKGNNLVLTRSALIDDIVATGIKNKDLAFEVLTSQEALHTQRGAVRHRRVGLAYRLWLAQRDGTWVPPKRVRPNFYALDRFGRRVMELRSKISENSHCVDYHSDPFAFAKMRLRLFPLVQEYTNLYKSQRKQPANLKTAIRRRAKGLYSLFKRGTRRMLERGAVHFSKLFTFRKQGVLVLAPSGIGSLGDEAVLSATVFALRDTGITPIDVAWPKQIVERPAIDVTNQFFLTNWFTSKRDCLSVVRTNTLARYAALAILGTDVLDGCYSIESSLRRLKLLRLAYDLGLKASAVGFSFDECAPPQILDAFAELPAGVRLYVRDPISHRFITNVLGKDAVLTADPAFLLPPDFQSVVVGKTIRWIDDLRDKGYVIVAVNVNHHLIHREKFTCEVVVDAFRGLLSKLSDQYDRIGFLIVPHDSRGNPSDMDLAMMLVDELPQNIRARTRIHPFPCRAAEIKATISRVDCVFTGKMHLAIAALSQAVPVGAITYKDHKFHGLFEHFKLEEMTLPSSAILDSHRVINFVSALIEKRDDLQSKIQGRLPYILDLARKNFHWVQDLNCGGNK